MKLSSKALIIIGLPWLIFIALTSFKAIRYSYPLFLTSTLICAFITFMCLRIFVINRVLKLNKKLAEVSKGNSLMQRVEMKGKDEVSETANDLNIFLAATQSSHQALEEHINKNTSQLQQSNLDLQREMVQRLSIEKELLGHRQYLTQAARYDSLTSLPNRIIFNEILNKSINHAKRYNKILAILLINLDSFRIIHDTFGGTKNDFLLKELGKRFATVLRSDDVLAKLDGDEFIVLLNDIVKPKFAGKVAEKLLSVCAKPIMINNREFSVKASIGICIFPNDGDSLEDLLKHVDIALYKVKHKGGGIYQFYTHKMDIEARQYILLETALRKAIGNNELSLHYQPKLNIKKGSIVGVEALMRWEHPEYGVISPSEFIPLAEEAGMMMQIGEWALREACKMNKQWQDEGYEHISIALNLSHKQFHDKNIAKVISDVLTETGLNPKYLELEITEKTAMDDAEKAVCILNEIKSTGVQLSLDHFGTGHTSISHLKQFPISALKIDQSFIKGSLIKPNDAAITGAIIALAHHLGLEVIAEGVETAEQVQHLAIENCDMVQGYFLCHPLPAQTIVLQFKKLQDEVLL